MLVWVPSHTPSWKQGFARYGHQSANPGLWKGLVGLWVPGLGPTGLTLRDVSGFGNHGTLTNMDPATDWVTTGQRGIPRALELSGVGEDIILPFSSSLAFGGTDAITLALWFKPLDLQEVASGARLLSQGDDIVMRFATDQNEVDFLLTGFGDGDRVNSGTDTINIGEWNLAVGTYDGSQIQLYVNGVLTDQATPSGTYGGISSDWFVGSNDGSGSFYGGQIGPQGIWKRALAPSENQQLHEDPMAHLRRRIQIFPAAVAAAGTILPQMTSAYLRTNA